MFVSLRNAAAVLSGLGLLTISACSSQPRATAGRTPEFYWSAAGETWSAGDYAKTADHLEHLIDSDNPYTARAIPWYLVTTSGMARGYSDLAERFAAGARINKANGAALRRESAKYRTVAGKMALRFAQDAERLKNIPLGKVQLAFAFPAGNPGEPPLFMKVGSGIEISPGERDQAETVAVQRGVLMTVCLAVGAANDIAKGREVLGHGSTDTTREVFATAIADMLKSQSGLFGRDKLDEPEKVAAFQQRAEMALAEGARVGTARIGLLVKAPEKD